MSRRLMLFAVAVAWIWPGAGIAQEMEEQAPPMLVISSWKCDFGEMGAIGQDWDGPGMAAAQAAVDAGKWYSAGVFYHDWADEWNVNYWAVGESEATLIEGQDIANAAYDDAMGDNGLNLWDVCSEHKDGFYQLAQGTSPEPGEPGPEMAISSWKCTDVGAVWQGWDDYVRAKAQAVVDAGTWNEAGMFVHAWAGEWNVNFYYMADDIPAILAGWEAMIDSFDDDAPNLTDVCFAHKDGFYTFGPTATSEGD